MKVRLLESYNPRDEDRILNKVFGEQVVIDEGLSITKVQGPYGLVKSGEDNYAVINVDGTNNPFEDVDKLFDVTEDEIKFNIDKLSLALNSKRSLSDKQLEELVMELQVASTAMKSFNKE